VLVALTTRLFTLGDLDEYLTEVEIWIRIAGDNLLGFYDSDTGRFWRASDQKKIGWEKKEKAPHSSTAMPRCIIGLLEYHRFLAEEGKSEDNPRLETVREASRKAASAYYTELDQFVESHHGDKNIFIDSQLLLTISLLRRQKDHGTAFEGLDDQIRKYRRSNEERFAEIGGRLFSSDMVHHFITFHAIRALDLASWTLGTGYVVSPEIEKQVEADLVKSLAYYSAGTSKFDITELVSETVLLDRISRTLSEQFAESSLSIISATQATGGGWPPGQPVSDENNAALYIPSYELALALTDFLLRRLKRQEMSSYDKIMQILARSLRLVKSQHQAVEGIEGWSNDHARRTDVVESWATAIVLTFLVHMHDTLLALRQWHIINELDGEQMSARPESFHWSEFSPLLRGPDQIREQTFNDNWIDPGEDRSITKLISDRYVAPVRDSNYQRPSPMGVSMILYGDPGGGKTLLAKSLARALGWPFIMLSTPTFLMKGLDLFEARAAEVFGMLLKLRRVVVLLDECEELFKARTQIAQLAAQTSAPPISVNETNLPRSSLESRTIGAFITSGMLTRLQKLHDNDWIIYILNTNVGPGQLDPAATRLGRFDIHIQIPLPCRQAQTEFIERSVKEPKSKEIMLDILKTNKEKVNFTILNDWTRLCKEKRLHELDAMSDMLASLTRRASNDSESTDN